MKKILFFSHESKMYGAPRSMLILARALQDNYNVKIITFGNGDLVDAATENGVQIEVIHSNFLSNIKSNMLISKLLRKIGVKTPLFVVTLKYMLMKPDLIYVNTIAKSFPLLLAKILRVKSIVHVREGSDYIFPEGRKRTRKTDFIFNNATAFICVSDSIKELVKKKLTQLKQKTPVVRVYNGIDCCAFEEAKSDDIEILDFPGKQVVGFLGNLSFRKGLDTFIEAAKTVLNKKENVVFLIVGGDESTFEEYSNAHGIGKFINHGIYHLPFQRNPHKVFKRFDIFCMTSRIEPFARVNLESACMGVPIIATNIDGNKEFVIDGTTGILTTPGNSDELVKNISNLLEDKNLKKKLTENAYKRVTRNFSTKKYIDECRHVIEKVI